MMKKVLFFMLLVVSSTGFVACGFDSPSMLGKATKHATHSTYQECVEQCRDGSKASEVNACLEVCKDTYSSTPATSGGPSFEVDSMGNGGSSNPPMPKKFERNSFRDDVNK